MTFFARSCVLVFAFCMAVTGYSQEWVWSSPNVSQVRTGETVNLMALCQDGTIDSVYPVSGKQFRLRFDGQSYTVYKNNDYVGWSGIYDTVTYSPCVFVNDDTGEVQYRTFGAFGGSMLQFGTLPSSGSKKVTWDYRIDFTNTPAGGWKIGQTYTLPWITIISQEDYLGTVGQCEVTPLFYSQRSVDDVFGLPGSVTWTKDGVPVVPSTYSALRVNRFLFMIESFDPVRDAGTYVCTYTSGYTGNSISKTFVVVDADAIRTAPSTPATQGTLINLSARARVSGDAKQLIGGLAVEGGKAKVLVRAAGPALGYYMDPSVVLSDPVLTAFSGQTAFAVNSSWDTGAGASEVQAAISSTYAFAFDAGSHDAAFVLSLDPGLYTFQITSASGQSGIALLEIYLIPEASNTGRIVNLSARADTGDGVNSLVTGFYAQGDCQLLLRGIGPGLAEFGVPGVLPATSMEVFRGSASTDAVGAWALTYQLAAANDIFARTGAFGLSSASADAISILNVSDNTPTTVYVRGGSAGQSGVCLAEVFLVNK